MEISHKNEALGKEGKMRNGGDYTRNRKCAQQPHVRGPKHTGAEEWGWIIREKDKAKESSWTLCSMPSLSVPRRQK